MTKLYLTLCLMLSVAHLTSAQTYEWVKNYKKVVTANAFIQDLSEQPNGDVIAAGRFEELTFGDSTYVSNNGSSGFIASYSSSGQEQWIRIIDNLDESSIDVVAMETDSAGNIYVLLNARTASYDNTSLLFDDGGDILLKTDPDGNLLWFRSDYVESVYEGLNPDAGIFIGDMCVAPDGTLYISSIIQGAFQFGSGESITNADGWNDIMLVAHNTDGTIQWVKQGTAETIVNISELVYDNDKLYLSGVYEVEYDQVDEVLDFGAFSRALDVNQTGEGVFVSQHDLYGNIQWLKGFVDDTEDLGTFSGKAEQIWSIVAGQGAVNLGILFTHDVVLGPDTLRADDRYGRNSDNYAIVNLDTEGNINWYRHVYGEDMAIKLATNPINGDVSMYGKYENIHLNDETVFSASPGLSAYYLATYMADGVLRSADTPQDDGFRDVLPFQSQFLNDNAMVYDTSGSLLFSLNYSATSEVTFGLDTYSDPELLLVKAQTSTPLFSVNLGPDIFQCQGTALLDAGIASSYTWSTGETTAIIEVDMSGSYAVEVTNQEGETASDTIAVVIDEPLVFQFPDTLRGTISVTLAPEVEAFIYEWTNGAVTPSITVTTSGVYGVYLITEGTCETYAETYVEIETLSIFNGGSGQGYSKNTLDGSSILFKGGAGAGSAVILLARESLLFAGGAGTGYASIWQQAESILFKGGSGVGYAVDELNQGTVLFAGGSGNGYATITKEAEDEVLSIIGQQLKNMHLSVYPNPATAYFKLYVNEDKKIKFDVVIYDLNGRELLSKQSMSPEDPIQITHLATGQYSVIVRSDSFSETASMKLIVK